MNCGRAARLCVSPLLLSPSEIDTKGRLNQKEADLTFQQNGETAVQKGMVWGKHTICCHLYILITFTRGFRGRFQIALALASTVQATHYTLNRGPKI